MNTLSKAPLMSMHKVDVVFPFLFPSSIRVARYMAASTADRFGLPPYLQPVKEAVSLCHMGQAGGHTFSEILPMQLSSEIGR